jgi:ribonuclease VapC
LISAFNALETGIVVEARKGAAGGREFDLLLHRARIEIVAMNADQTELARAAWSKYGKGNHPAGLNIGDCCAYALAKYSGEPLLFKGNDFSQTDIQAALKF